MTKVKMIGNINRTQGDHDLICRLIAHHEKMLKKLDELTGIASNMKAIYAPSDFTQGYATASTHLYEDIKKVFDFAQELKDY